MANTERGEVGIEVGGKPYTLRPTFNAVCELEELLDKDIDEVLVAINRGRLSSIRAVVWVLLQDEHAIEFPTLRHASEFVEKIGVDRVMALLAKMFGLNFEEVGKSNPNPPKARAKTGARSGKRREASA